LTEPEPVSGDIPLVFGNPEGLYEGNLWYYFSVVNRAPNARNPYHNVRHVLHTMWLMYRACAFHRAELSKRRIRNTLIAGAFHDHAHLGKGSVPDEQNIALAQAGATTLIATEDRLELSRIKSIIGASLYTQDGHQPVGSLEEAIMQDADTAQALHPAWYSMIAHGLAAEFGLTMEEMLERQLTFLGQLHFNTAWAKETFPQARIDAKIAETRIILDGLRSMT
jgi:hypothetical protein